MMLDLIDNVLLVYLTVEEKGQTRPKKYPELTEAQQLQDDCDVQATNIILHCLPPDVYALVNHQEAAKDIWDRSVQCMPYYWMTLQQVQVQYRFESSFTSEWSMFVTDVKLAKSLYTTNYDQLYAYLSQHERHANEFRIMRERYPDPLALVANSPTLYNPSQSPQHSVTQHSQADFPQLDSCLAVPTFQQGEDPIECINKVMAFLSAVESRGIAITLKGNYAAGQPRVVKCYNYQGERHMTRQCTQPKRPRNAAWFKEKLMLAEAQEAVAQQTIPQNSAFQTEDLDAYDSDCDDLSLAKAILMENLSSCDVQEMQYSEQTHIDYFQENKIHSDSNIIPYSQYLQESQDAVIHDTNSSAPNDLLVLSLVEQMTNHVAHLDKENQTNKMRIQPTLYDGGVIAIEHAVISVIDDEETLILEEDCDQRCLAKEVAANKENDEVNVVKKVVKVINTAKLIVDDAQVSAAGNVVSTASAATTVSATNKENDEVNVVEEVVEVINTAKLNVDNAQVSADGNVVSITSAATTVSVATTTTDDVDDITLAQALAEIKSTKPKMKRVIIQELGESITKISSQQSQDKSKGILIEPCEAYEEKDQFRPDEKLALKLQSWI
ncbi:hypothetical protein Tco_1343173 [Tanacetum coccineum]